MLLSIMSCISSYNLLQAAVSADEKKKKSKKQKKEKKSKKSKSKSKNKGAGVGNSQFLQTIVKYIYISYMETRQFCRL